MKKLAITIGCACLVTGAAFAQGNVNWTGPSAASFTADTNTVTYSSFTGGGSSGGGSVGLTQGAASLGTGFYYALLYTSGTAAAPTTLNSLNTWTATGLTATNNAASPGKAVVVNGNSGAQVPWSPGTTDSIVLVGWSADLGTTYAQALQNLQNWSTGFGASLDGALAFFGISNVGAITPNSTSTSPGAAVFGTAATANGTPIDSLNTPLYELNPVSVVPEPGTMALAGLGGLSLLAFRRKK